MPRWPAQSSTAVASAPDCDTNASPLPAAICVKLAFNPSAGDCRPTLPAPRMRSRCGLAASSIGWRRLRPPLWPGSAVITMAALVPACPSSLIRPGTVAGGVQMMARSAPATRSPAVARQAVQRRAWD
jgi:hypothetical protein